MPPLPPPSGTVLLLLIIGIIAISTSRAYRPTQDAFIASPGPPIRRCLSSDPVIYDRSAHRTATRLNSARSGPDSPPFDQPPPRSFGSSNTTLPALIEVCVGIISQQVESDDAAGGSGKSMETLVKKALRSTSSLDNNAARALISRWCLGVTCWKGRLAYLLQRAMAMQRHGSSSLQAQVEDKEEQRRHVRLLLAVYLLDRHDDPLMPSVGVMADREAIIRQHVLAGDPSLWSLASAAVADVASSSCWPSCPEESLAARHALPLWLAVDLIEQYGMESEEIASACNTVGPVTIRANLLKCRRDELLASLAAAGVEAAPTSMSRWGLRLVKGRPPTGLWSLDDWRLGRMEVQDEGSQMIALLTGAKPGQTVVDYCAGNGGKTLALAAMMGGVGEVWVNDVDESRLRQLVGAARRAGADHMVTRSLLQPEGRHRLLNDKGGADVVLVDAPCSSSGVLRRHPSLRWTLQPEEAHDEYPRLQRGILVEAKELVRPGGRLVYATCSILRFTESFAADFVPEPIAATCTTDNEEEEAMLRAVQQQACVTQLAREVDHKMAVGQQHQHPHRHNYLCLLPHLHGTDGFFIARWRRRD